MTIQEILQMGTPQEIIAALKAKSIIIPKWGGVNGLRDEYFHKRLRVMN